MNYQEFNELKKYSEASGSLAVVDSNIRMQLNSFGLYEEQLADDNLSISGEILDVSPNFNDKTNESKVAEGLYGEQKNIQFDSRIGYYNSLYIGYVNEGYYRDTGSSGGMGTWIFDELLRKKMIDHVIHVKRNEDKDSEIMFKYDISSTTEEIKNGAKTKYYPVEFSKVIKIVKENPGRYAIVGIPSFIYAIRLLAEKDDIIKERVKYTVGLICGHQKSSKFAESMAWQVGIKPGDLKEIDFRHKLLDRPASKYAVKMTGLVEGEEKTIVKPTSELYGQNWGWGMFKPLASNFTDDVFAETADIVFGDAWLPEYTEDSKGNNIVIIRNSEISKLISNALTEDRLKLDIVNKETIFASQSSHYRHTHDELAYRLYLKEQDDEWHPKKRVKTSSDISENRRKIQDMRTIISNQSHIQYKRAVEKQDFNYFIEQMSKHTAEYEKLYAKKARKDRITRIRKLGISGIIKKIWKKFKK